MTDLSTLVGLVGVAVAVLVVAVVAAPFESLGWWAGWYGRRDELQQDIEECRAAGRADAGDHDYYVVFLSGIGSISGDALLPLEEEFLADLARRLPRGRVVADVFPYAVHGVPLTGRRAFAWLWRRLHAWRLGGGNVLTNLVNLRNLFQVLVSADSRYGPIFNYGVSRQVVRALLRAGYPLGEPRPVFLLGSSGGGQIAVGAATYLKGSLDAPVEVISLGGVMASDPGLLRLDHLTHVYGTRDGVQTLGPRLFPSRLPSEPQSAWNRARRAGRIETVALEGIRHNGVGGYLDDTTPLEDEAVGSPVRDTPRRRTLAAVESTVARRLAVYATQRPVADAHVRRPPRRPRPADRTEDAGRTVAVKVLLTGLPLLTSLVVGIVVTALALSWAWSLALWLGGVTVILLVAAVRPVPTRQLAPAPAPTRTYEEARQRFHAVFDAVGPDVHRSAASDEVALDDGQTAPGDGKVTLDGEERALNDGTAAPYDEVALHDEVTLHDEVAPHGLHRTGASRIWDHGQRTASVVVLVHGLSNSPHAMVALGPLLHARGHTVIAPRMPHHGHADLATDALRLLRAEDLCRYADAAVDVAAGLGERVTVLGISAGGVVAAWMGQTRPEVARTVLVAPALGIASLGPLLNRFVMRLLLLLPSASLWKDPRLKSRFPGLGHNYKRQHTRGVAEMERLGLAVTRRAATTPPATRSVALLTNAGDRAVDNGMAVRLAARWARSRPVARHELPRDLRLGHEIIDPADPEGDTSVTYPILIELVEDDFGRADERGS